MRKHESLREKCPNTKIFPGRMLPYPDIFHVVDAISTALTYAYPFIQKVVPIWTFAPVVTISIDACWFA